MKKKIVKVNEVKIESLIKRNFSEEFMRKIYNVYIDDCMSIVEKTIAFDKMFTEEFGHRKDYRRIGEGTNRFVCLLDNHIIKVAYNYLAYIDNMNELAQAKYKPTYLAQAYETNGIILVSEYVTVMDKEEFLENQTAIGRILSILEADRDIYNPDKSKYYILGDMGMSNKNYGNWGRRMNGEIVILDYGYLYELSRREWNDVARCPLCNSPLEYTEDYSELKCTDTNCISKVKYTTVRNAFGYANIIENIKYNLNNDKYIKFNEKGEIVVDVMEEIVIEEEPKEEFKMPEDEETRLNISMEKFFELASYIKRHGEINIDDKISLKEELFENQEEYDEILFPCLIGVLEVRHNHIDKYLKDFDKLSRGRYNQVYVECKREFEINKPEDDLELDEDFVDYIDEESEGFNVKGFESNVKLVDKFEDDEAKKITSLDEILGSTIDDCFNNIFMADESENLDKIEEDNEYSLEHIMKLLDEEQTMEEMKEDSSDEDETIEDRLIEAYERLEDALTDTLTNYYIGTGKLMEDEEDYVTGDVYRTYLNGDKIDLDYSPRVNAKNILGGYQPDKFAFPLYRHMLIKFDHDTELVDEEYEATYRIGQTVEMVEDMYSNLENRSIVINQIMDRFETGVPAKHVFINTIGKELNDYYEVLDEYYDSLQESNLEVGINNPDYYLNIMKNNDHVQKMLNEAKLELVDELSDQGLKLNDVKDTHKIVYYYDIESLMSNTELNILNLVKSNKFVTRRGDVFDNIKDTILNKYYMEHGSILYDDVFDVFKYGGSTVKEVGCETHPRLVRPGIKAKLVPIDSNEDSYKPDMFNKKKYIRFIVEQRYEVIFNAEDPEEVTKMNDFRLELNKRDLYYTESILRRYSVKGSKENKRYALTEKELEFAEEYERLLSITEVRDIDRVFKKAVVEIMDRKYNFNKETKEFMKDLAKFDMSEAIANRLFKINILELSGSMTRLDFLQRVEG